MTDTLNLRTLTHGQRAAYEDTLNTSHVIDIDIYSLDKNEANRQQLNPAEYAVVSGQVDVDLSADVSRQLSLDLALFKSNSFHNDVQEGPFHPAKFIDVVYKVLVPSIDAWVEVNVFYGPTTHVAFDEAAGTLHVEAQSKETLFLPPNYSTKTESSALGVADQKTLRLDDFIRRVAKNHGETKFRLTRTKPSDKLQLTRAKLDAFVLENGAWPAMQRAARGFGYRLYYDREGFLNLKSLPKTKAATFWSRPNSLWCFSAEDFTDPNGKHFYGNVASLPAVAFSVEDFRNKVLVYGLKKKNAKTPTLIDGWYFGAGSFGSETDLARNGHRRDVTEVITVDGVLSHARAKDIALRTLKAAQLVSVQSSFTALPVPHLDVHDPVMLHDVFRGVTDFSPTKWTLPLVPDDLMSVGFNKRVRVVSKTRGHIRHRQHRNH